MEQLRKWRLSRRKDKTLVAVSALFGVSAVQLCRYETGRREIPPRRAPKISEVTGIPLHVLCPTVFPEPKKRGK